ncbi:MAG TPA: hypothetical protein VHI13_12775 [Candidatus Kapabacteria bacterium]|nr:hypothetical protein [Candidatus Kapabacteria bacterium]
MRTLVAALLSGLLLAGCTGGTAGFIYDRVDIVSGRDVYHGTILSNYKDVEKSEKGLILKPGARFAIKTDQLTQTIGQFDVAILAGDGVNVYLRTVADKFDTTKGIAFRYATNGCSVRESDGTIVPLPYNAENEQQTLSFYNESNLLSIQAGCKRLYEEQCSLPETEYTIFETLPGSTVEIRSAAYFDTNAN